ncbi:hypothetical protein M413DRAFT_258869 [Hebeloma cylindrosporum]|uniref:Cytosine deaminase n=1 Tax=Hebeloma cylindrosporum TaxID=76867 RepID=A0A0C2Y9E8_HEBCY|nr:hypothetical protein M413DRAFT_258869 [Hebeloma cylindrosporum h7]
MSSNTDWNIVDRTGLELALQQARRSYQEGGIPIGSVLLLPDRESSTGFVVLGAGHNERMQKKSPTLHGEISALENAGRQKAETYRSSVLYTTLSPCSMCSGAILLYKIPRVVIGENDTFLGEEDLLRSRGVDIVVLKNQECKDLMTRFIAEKPEEWNEDIGEFRDGKPC